MAVYYDRLGDIMTKILKTATTTFKNVAKAMIVKVLFKHYQTITQRNPPAYKSSRIFIYLIFQKICQLTAFLLASQAAHFPEKDLVRQNLGKPQKPSLYPSDHKLIRNSPYDDASSDHS